MNSVGVTSPQAGLTLVIATHDEGDQLWRTVANLAQGLPDGSEILVVDDESADGSVGELERRVPQARVIRPGRRLGVASARNLGAARASGDVLIFADAHVRATQSWAGEIVPVLADEGVGMAGAVVARMRYPQVRGYGLRFIDTATNLEWLCQQAADPYPVPVLGGFFLAVRRDVFHAVGGFDGGMRIYGMEDPEMCLRMWTFGYRCVLVPSVVIRHAFRTHEHQLGWTDGLHNILRLGILHFSAERLELLLAHYQHDTAFPAAMVRLTDSDVWERREWMRANRVHDDDWYFGRLNPALSSPGANVTLL